MSAPVLAADAASHLDSPGLLGTVGLAVLGGLGMYFLIGAIFELAYYRRREQAAEWKCQPGRWPTPRARRHELWLGTANLTAASVASGLFVHHVTHGGYTTMYVSLAEHGLAYSIASGVGYLVVSDLLLYWAHRLFHTPALYRGVHKLHHRWGSPTAFTAMAMHPIEFATYQSIAILPLFVVPLHAYAVIAVLVVTNYYALVDHSGVKTWSWLPFIAPSQFHDDHHAHFHVNYGQTLPFWDRMFGTARRRGRRYGVEVFGGKGAGDAAAPAAPFWDYARGATNDEPAADSARAAAR